LSAAGQEQASWAGFRGPLCGEQAQRVRNFHRELETYLRREK
jgi:hypothetical protein